MTRNSGRRHRFKARNYADDNEVIQEDPLAISAREDFDAFVEYVGGLPAIDHHREWSAAWVTHESSTLENGGPCLNKVAGEDVSILAPRGSAKSTRIGYLVAWVIGHNPHIQILYLSYALDVAVSRSRLIKRIIETPKYQRVFPHIKPGKRWADQSWEIDKGFAEVENLEADFTFYAQGILGSITSKRAHAIFFDDLIKNRKSIKNPEIRKEMVTNIKEVIKPCLIPGGRYFSVGTRFLPSDIHVTYINEKNGWKVIEQSAILIDENGREVSYWPGRHPLVGKDGLWAKRTEDVEIFSFQYQNKVMRIAEISIDPAWIIYVVPKPEYLEYAIGMDLSGKKSERADFTAMVFGGYDGAHCDVIDAIRGRWPGNYDKIDRLLEMCADERILDMYEDGEDEDGTPIYKYRVTDRSVTIYPEAVQYQVSFQSDFKRRVHKELNLWNIRCKPAVPKGDKDLRLKGCTGAFQQGVIRFNRYRDLLPLKTELTEFGSTPNDDLADAFVYMFKGLTKRRKLGA